MPAVQALGQCIFLPMLIIGGVAVQLASLPAWAQHLSAFFPGRYAVEAMQAAVNGGGLDSTRFSLLALAMIGAAGFLAGIKMFRWDAQQRFASRGGKGWLAVALAGWAAVGLLAESRGLIGVTETRAQLQTTRATEPPPGEAAVDPAPQVQPQPAPAPTPPPTPPAESPGAPTSTPSTSAGFADRAIVCAVRGRPGFQAKA